MGKTILKTVLITLSCLIVFEFLLFGFLYLVVPSSIVKMSDDLGLVNLEMSAREREYKRLVKKEDDAFEYLVELVEFACINDKYSKINEYGEELISSSNFEIYAQTTNKTNYKQSIYGYISVAKYRLGNLQEGVDLAVSINKSSFTKNNAVVYLIMDVSDKNVVADKETLYNELSNKIDSTLYTPVEQQDYLLLLNSLKK